MPENGTGSVRDEISIDKRIVMVTMQHRKSHLKKGEREEKKKLNDSRPFSNDWCVD
jgi:hypothetical protein